MFLFADDCKSISSDLPALELWEEGFVELEKFVFVVRVEKKVLFGIVVEEVGSLAGSEPQVRFKFFESHGSDDEVASFWISCVSVV